MKRILLVDDDLEVRRGIRWALERNGFSVIEAADGNQATEIAVAERVDLMITDIMMPEKDGLETIMEVRRRRPGIKIIAISGGGLMDPDLALKMALKLGARHILPKPFAMQEILTTVEYALRTN